ncbi:Hypothetical protein A7982_06524 [Minicystis rosea]|nr:Hypothetical protein A7982_06524 [Minicystis rosea]
MRQKEGIPIQKGTTNRYVAKVPSVGVGIAFRRRDGQPWANEPCFLYGIDGEGSAAEPRPSQLDENGVLSLVLPVYVREIQVVFPEKNHAEFNVRVGEMDPLTTRSGIRKRLLHLGHRDAPAEDAEEGDEMAVASFQMANGIPVTGALDDATREALAKGHGY